MDDSDKPSGEEGAAEGDSPGGGTRAAPTSSSRPQQPIGGMVRDPREVKTNPSLTRFLREYRVLRMVRSYAFDDVSFGCEVGFSDEIDVTFLHDRDPAELLHENVSGLLDGFNCEIKHDSILAQILPAKYAKGREKKTV